VPHVPRMRREMLAEIVFPVVRRIISTPMPRADRLPRRLTARL
jgi:hypothetical protein